VSLLAGTRNRRYSLPGGIVAAVLVALGYLASEPTMSLGAVFFVGILVGFLSKRQYGSSTGTGVVTGVIGALPIGLILVRMLTATAGLSGPAWFTAAGTVLAALAALCVGVLGVALSALIGEVGARIGGVIPGSTRPSPTAA